MEEDKIQEILLMHDAGITPANIAAELNASVQTVRRLLKERGREPLSKVKPLDEEGIAKAYQAGESVPKILKDFHINYGVLYRVLQENEVPLRKVAGASVTNMRIERAVELYLAGAPLWSIKQETGVPQPTLHAELHKREITLRRPRLI